jgi:PAS domain S-box-containing protein
MAFLLMSGAALPVAGQETRGKRPQVLLLNSYNQGTKWTDDEIAGITFGFDEAGIYPQYYIEYLDAKNYNDQKYFNLLERIIRKKYQNKQFDLILVTDDYAFNFLRQHVRDVFPDVPAVFCGLNNFDLSRLEGEKLYTGVNELADLKATINLALRLHPDTRHLFVINDQTVTGRHLHKNLIQALAGISKQVKIEIADDLTMQELEERLRSLGSDSIVFYVLFARDKAGVVYGFAEGIDSIIAASPVPVYVSHEIYMGRGVVGGMLTSGYYQGKAAAMLAVKILDGKKPSDTPVIMGGANKYIFDYHALKRFSIPMSKLPTGAKVINLPASILDTHPTLVAIVVVVFVSLLVTILILLIYTAKVRRAERAARESEEKYSQVFGNTSDLIYSHDLAGRLLAVNPAFCNTLGYGKEELIGTKFSDYLLHEFEKGYRDKYLQVVIDTGVHNGMSVCRNRQGEEIILEYRSFLVNRGDNQVYISGTARDVTDKIRAELSLKDSEERYRLVFNESPDAIAMSEMSTALFIDVNQGFSKITGYSREEAVGKTLFDLNLFVNPHDRERYIDEIMRKGRVDDFDIQVRAKDGSIRDVLLSACKIRYAGTDCLAAVVKDQTNLKEAERAKNNLEKQLQQAQKMEAIGTLTGGIAHDFNNILSVILGFGELAQLKAYKKQDNTPQIEQMISAVVRARDLVKQLMTFSRRTEPDLKPLDLNQLVSRSIKMLKHTLPKMIHIKTELAVGLEPVLAGATQLEQVLLNLANNARDAMPNGGDLLFSTSSIFIDSEFIGGHLDLQIGRYVKLSVADTGNGMDEGTLSKIYDPFFTTKEIGEGTGLGLSTVYGIIRQHGGHIDCMSRPGRGTTFQIYLPAHQADHVAAEDEAPLHLPSLGGSETVLLVDDEENIREIGKEMLVEVGYQAISAASGEEALEYFERMKPKVDLVILDLGMPGMGGQRCMQELLSKYPDLKVLIASGYLAGGKDKELILDGAVGHIAKPFRRVDLLTKIRRVLDS